MEELYDLPQNRLRKAMALRECIGSLESLQRRYGPIFDEDPAVNRLLQQLRSEHEAVMAVLRNRDDAVDLLKAEK